MGYLFEKSKVVGVLVAVAMLGMPGVALAQDAGPDLPTRAIGDLAKQAQNPIANMISLPFQNNTNFKVGPNDRTQNTLNLQPVLPFSLGKWNLITRTIVPILSRPDLSATTGGTSGLGDINTSLFLSPAAPSKVTWAVGGAFYFPTATDDALGSDKWSAGPSVIALTMPGKWLVGALASNVWSYAGDPDEPDVNSFLLQYFINYNLPNHWYLTSSPIITANWLAGDGNKWTIPFGGGVGKIFSIGSQPVNSQIQAFWYAVRPEAVAGPPPGGLPPGASNGAGWTLRIQFQLLFPKG